MKRLVSDSGDEGGVERVTEEVFEDASDASEEVLEVSFRFLIGRSLGVGNEEPGEASGEFFRFLDWSDAGGEVEGVVEGVSEVSEVSEESEEVSESLFRSSSWSNAGGGELGGVETKAGGGLDEKTGGGLEEKSEVVSEGISEGMYKGLFRSLSWWDMVEVVKVVNGGLIHGPSTAFILTTRPSRATNYRRVLAHRPRSHIELASSYFTVALEVLEPGCAGSAAADR